MVAEYYWTIRSILKQHPHLNKYLTRCKHCQILFFTHPRNAGRSDLGCPFGCRKAHRRKKSNRRSTEYYRTQEGKEKKKHLNAARSRQNRLSKPGPEEKEDGRAVDSAMVGHIQLVCSLIEGRWVGLSEILAMLDKILRQHSIDCCVKLPYGLRNAQRYPP
jgi:hypothetical protein